MQNPSVMDYDHLITELNNFLRKPPFYMNTNTSDVFEEILLKLAGVEKKSEKSWKARFLPAAWDPARSALLIEVKGLEERDSEKFLKFLIANGDTEAAELPLNDEEFTDESDEFNDKAAHFVVSMEVVFKNILPMFKAEIIRLTKENPALLDDYRKACENDNAIKEYKLLEKIDSQIIEVEEENLDEFAKGEMHVVVKNLKDAIELNKNHRDHGCGQAENLIMAYNLFIKICEGIPALKDSEKLVNLKDSLQKYCELTCNVTMLAVFQTKVAQMFKQFILAKALNSKQVNPEPSPKSKSIFGSIWNFFRSGKNSHEESLDLQSRHRASVNVGTSSSGSSSESSPESSPQMRRSH